MQVKPIYMEQIQVFVRKATVISMGAGEINKKRYQWVQLDETLFHPKGGGQLADQGTIGGIKVAYVHKESPDKNRFDLFNILHCFDEGIELPFKVGDEVELIVDEQARKLSSRMHTAGHVLAESVKKLYPGLIPYHGNHDPKDGYVKFKMTTHQSYDLQEIKQRAQSEIKNWIDKNDSVSVIMQEGVRTIQFSNTKMTCGGTHVEHLNEIGEIMITDISCNNKEKTITVKYELAYD